MHFEKSPSELIGRFGRFMDERFPDVERRKMFGYPAAFANGHMFTGLHGSRWVVRLPDNARAELLAMDGAVQFEPMPGRPMKEYAVFPSALLDDPDALVPWIRLSLGHVRSLPPKG